MPQAYPKYARLSEGDLDFLIETASPGATDKFGLRRILREDDVLRNAFIQDERVARRVLDDDQVFLKISPNLFFEILLRKAATDLKQVRYTIEKTSTMTIPVFDTDDLVEFLSEEAHLFYLTDMLASFTKIQSYTIAFRVRKGSWRTIRFNDLDIQSLMTFCEVVEEESKLSLYKRIADLCLFILGLFPEYIERDYRYPFSGQLRPQIRGRARMSPADYEQEGRKFYKMAAEHRSAQELNLSEVFWALHGNFPKAKKPLNFIADHYLHAKKHQLFG